PSTPSGSLAPCCLAPGRSPPGCSRARSPRRSRPLTAAAKRIAGGDYSPPTNPRCVRAITMDSPANEIVQLARAFDTMRARVATAAAELRVQRDVLEAVLDSTGDGMLVMTPKGR